MHSPKCPGLDKVLHTWHIVHGLMSDGPEGCVFIMGRCVDGTPADWTVIGVHTSGSSYSFEARGQNMCNHFRFGSCRDTKHNHEASDSGHLSVREAELIRYQDLPPRMPALSPPSTA